jgi:alpha-galactosidase
VTDASPIALAAAGVSLIVDASGPGLPRVVHFGADVDPVALEPAAGPSLLPGQADGWYGRPALEGHRDGATVPVRWTLDEPATVVDGALTVRASDAFAGLRLESTLHLDEHGALRIRHTLTNTADTPYTLSGLVCALPVPARAGELLDCAGRWSKEKVPQRAPFRFGVWSRENRRGRTGHDAPGLLVAGAEGFGFRHGAVWGVHAGWSGNHLHYAERLIEGGSVLAAGELLASGEIRLGTGESYETPWAYFTYASDGLDTASARLHGHLRSLRSRPTRPVTLNNWEATYFDHRLERLLDLATRAAEVGVERFVLDDGWFRHRRDDHAGLGDWFVDEGVWPDGLHPLVKHVRSLGMQFGLWFEPEMVNPDSDLAREHPDWILGQPGRWPAEHRNQQTLDLARPEAYDYLLARLDALVTEYALDYIKWDHNRDIAEPVHDGVLGVHRQTAAVYRLLDELRGRHPDLEIESCSSGGARIDFGILQRTDRVWTSDCNDALERQTIQRWTGLLVPPELLGAHVGAPVDHVTGRAVPLAFRCLTALFGHMGVEWDITAAGDAERAELADWIQLHKRLRPVLHGGTVVRADRAEPTTYVHGVVTPDRTRAVFAFAQLAARVADTPEPIRLPGLDPVRSYTVTVVGTRPEGARMPGWTAGPVTLSGATLAEVGLPAPLLRATTGLVLELT